MKVYPDLYKMDAFVIPEEMVEYTNAEERFGVDLSPRDSTDVLVHIYRRETIHDKYEQLFYFKIFEFILDSIDDAIPLGEIEYTRFKAIANQMKAYADIILASIEVFGVEWGDETELKNSEK